MIRLGVVLAQLRPSCGQTTWGFRAFFGECMEGMVWNLTFSYIRTTSRNDSISVSIRPISALWWPPKTLEMRIPGIRGITDGRYGPQLGMQMYLGHLQNCLTFGHGPMISLFVVHFLTWVKRVGSGNFLENAWRGQPEKGERRHIFDSLYLVLSGLSLVLWHRWELCYHRCHRDRRAFAIGEGNDWPFKA